MGNIQKRDIRESYYNALFAPTVHAVRCPAVGWLIGGRGWQLSQTFSWLSNVKMQLTASFIFHCMMNDDIVHCMLYTRRAGSKLVSITALEVLPLRVFELRTCSFSKSAKK